MANAGRHDEETLADLLGLLRPAPPAWVLAAQEIASARQQVDTIVERFEADAAFRRALELDLERGLREAGFAVDREAVETVRARIAPP